MLSVLRYWRDVEFFVPFDLERVLEGRSANKVIPVTVDAMLFMPWDAPEQFGLDPDALYSFDLFFAPFLKKEVSLVLQDKFPQLKKESFDDTKGSDEKSCCGRISISPEGRFATGDISVSTLPWAVNGLLNNSSLSLDEFDNSINQAITKLESDLVLQGCYDHNTDKNIINHTLLLHFVSKFVEGLELNFFIDGIVGYILPIKLFKKREDQADNKDVEVKREKILNSWQALLKKKRKIDILNSFYLRDLSKIAENNDFNNGDGSKSVISEYLNGLNNYGNKRFDLLKENSREIIKKIVSKKHLPLGRWPAPLSQSASLGQQIAVNIVKHKKNPIVAVNGPPGTGKTVLVRDVIADFIVRRAVVLSKLAKPEEAFTTSSFNSIQTASKKNIKCRFLKENITGFEIVVASSNNLAVENISRQLPSFDSLGDEFSDRSYLRPLARMYEKLWQIQRLGRSGDTAGIWGALSIPLGKRVNRELAYRSLQFGVFDELPNGKKERLDKKEELSLLELRNTAIDGRLSFRMASQQFKDCQKKILNLVKQEEFQDSSHPLFFKNNLLNTYELQSKAPLNFLELNKLRTDLFFSALKLHEAWVIETPQFQNEIIAVSSLLQNPSSFNSQEALKIWQLLFMIFPVVSTTLASVERMFSNLNQSSLGLVIIDEAGQATPQSAAGILFRAKQALIVGDQQQLKPIVQIPDAIDDYLLKDLPSKIKKIASPKKSSVQTLADQQSIFGTALNVPIIGQKWVGIPLIVHRRCLDPMFKLSNAIAYGGIMIRGEAHNLAHHQPEFGGSCWIDVKGATKQKQWVAEHGAICLDIMLKIIELEGQGGISDLFFITPFKVVKQKLNDLANKVRQDNRLAAIDTSLNSGRIGTVHTFQGKEADLVFFVLGVDLKTAYAADWAGREPNLLNVALTRARKGIYVIGDADGRVPLAA